MAERWRNSRVEDRGWWRGKLGRHFIRLPCRLIIGCLHVRWDQAELRYTQTEERTELLAEVRTGHRDTTFPATDGESVGANLACHIFLRPATLHTRPLEMQIRSKFGRLLHNGLFSNSSSVS